MNKDLDGMIPGNNRYTAIFETESSFIYGSSSSGKGKYISENSRDFAFYKDDPDDFLTLFTGNGIFANDLNILKDLDAGIRKGQEYGEANVRLLLKSGEYIWCNMTFMATYDGEANLNSVTYFIKNINGILKAVDTLRSVSDHDSLTNASTFSKFSHDARIKLNDYDFSKGSWAIIYDNIKNFKYVNSVYGHDIGDAVLIQVADQLSRICKPQDSFCRLSDDRFVLMIEYQDIDKLKKKVLKIATDAIFSNEHFQFNLDIAMGAYCISRPEEILSLFDMIDRANIAQKTIKDVPGSSFAVFEERMRQDIIFNHEFQRKVKEAIDRKEMTFFLQAQVNIQNGKKIAGAEALARWIKEDGQVISPAGFIAVAELDGSITEIDRYIFEEVCRYWKSRRDDNRADLKIAVNVSRISMMQVDFVQRYIDIKNDYGIPDGFIELEFTESTAMFDLKKSRSDLEILKANGFIIAIDDFGTGYSSLSVIKDLPIDVLKLDMRFVQEGIDNPEGQAIVSNIIMLAKILKLKIVAEGVENVKQLEFLEKIGCDVVQGYLFARPVSSDRFKIRDIIKSISIFEREHGTITSRNSTSESIMNMQFYRELKNLVDNAMGGLVQFAPDKEKTVVYANKGFYKLIGYTPAEFSNEQNSEFSRIIIQSTRSKPLNTRLVIGENDDTEYQVRRRDKSLIWIREQSCYQGDGSYYGFLSDISKRKSFETKAKTAAMDLTLIMRNIPCVILKIDCSKNDVVFINDYFETLTGYRKNEAKKILGELLPDDSLEYSKTLANGNESGEYTIEKNVTIKHKNGDTIYTLLRGRILFDDGKQYIYLTLNNTTQQKQLENQVRIHAERYRILEETTNAILYDYDLTKDMFSYSKKSPDCSLEHFTLPKYLKDFENVTKTHPNFAEQVKLNIIKATEQCLHETCEYISSIYGNGYRWVRMHYTSVVDNEGRITNVVGRIQDIEEEMQSRMEIYHRLELDSMTDLYNRKTATAKIKDAIAFRDDSMVCAMIVMNINDFKVINETLGYAYGDRVIKIFAEGLLEVFKDNDICSRYDGNEFMILAYGGTKENIFEKIKLFKKSIDSHQEISLNKITYSIGISFIDEEKHDFDSIMKEIDRSLYDNEAGEEIKDKIS